MSRPDSGMAATNLAIKAKSTMLASVNDNRIEGQRIFGIVTEIGGIRDGTQQPVNRAGLRWQPVFGCLLTGQRGLGVFYRFLKASGGFSSWSGHGNPHCRVMFEQ